MQSGLNSKIFVCLGLGLVALPCWTFVQGEDNPFSQPLEEPIVVRDQLTSGESDEVPPEPVPPSEYQALDSRAPERVAEEIMRLRDILGSSPLAGRSGFRPLTLANKSDEEQANSVPWNRKDDRRDFRERLQGMASRPMLPQPLGVPYGANPYQVPAFVGHPVPHVYMHPQPVHAPGFEPEREVYCPAMGPPSAFATREIQGEKQIEILRQTAHQLEQTAHQLECCEQFERADQVRQLAELLRQDARQGRRASDATALRAVRPAAAGIDHLLRARYPRTTAEVVENPFVQTEQIDSEPSCPACPATESTPQARRSTPLEEKLPNQQILRSVPLVPSPY